MADTAGPTPSHLTHTLCAIPLLIARPPTTLGLFWLVCTHYEPATACSPSLERRLAGLATSAKRMALVDIPFAGISRCGESAKMVVPLAGGEGADRLLALLEGCASKPVRQALAS